MDSFLVRYQIGYWLLVIGYSSNPRLRRELMVETVKSMLSQSENVCLESVPVPIAIGTD